MHAPGFFAFGAHVTVRAMTNTARRAMLEAAEARGNALFDAAGLIAPGKRESALSDEVAEFARAGFGVSRHCILEIHLVAKARSFGGFYEGLL